MEREALGLPITPYASVGCIQILMESSVDATIQSTLLKVNRADRVILKSQQSIGLGFIERTWHTWTWNRERGIQCPRQRKGVECCWFLPYY